tara:strand:+ start:257 stop:373 length:117 start_codon:yes stop_codon:yes gene_type:complete
MTTIVIALTLALMGAAALKAAQAAKLKPKKVPVRKNRR